MLKHPLHFLSELNESARLKTETLVKIQNSENGRKENGNVLGFVVAP